MLMLPALNRVLKQIVFPPDVLTAILLTPSGDLVSYVSHEGRPKDDIRLLTGLSAEVWSETKEHGIGMVDSEVRSISVDVSQFCHPHCIIRVDGACSRNED